MFVKKRSKNVDNVCLLFVYENFKISCFEGNLVFVGVWNIK